MSNVAEARTIRTNDSEAATTQRSSDVCWDGRLHSYIPPDRLAVCPELRLHQDFDPGVDPITYQVLRSRFWHANLEHGDLITRIAGSYIIVYALDFNVALLTESGDTVAVGPTIQYFATNSDLTVKWTLENLSTS